MTKRCACNSTTYKNNLVYSLTGSNRNSQLLIKGMQDGAQELGWLAIVAVMPGLQCLSGKYGKWVRQAWVIYIYIFI
jgi:hypothetical protein